MLLDEAVGGVGAGQLAGVGAPGAAYGRPGAQRAQQPRQVAAAKGPGPAGAAPGGALRHEAGAPLQLRALGPRLGSALGKISESAEWAEESARGAADAALDDEFEALFAEAAGLRAPWAEEAGSAPSLPSAAGGAAPAGPVAEAEPHPALEAAAGIVAAGAEAEARAPSEASLESRAEALLEASGASQPEPEPRGPPTPSGAGPAGSAAAGPAEARAQLAEPSELEEPGDGSTADEVGAEPLVARLAPQGLEEPRVSSPAEAGAGPAPARGVLEDAQVQEAEVGEEGPPSAQPALQGPLGLEGSIEMETSEEEPPPAKPVFQDRQAEEGSIEIEMSGEEPPPAKAVFQDRQAEEGSIEIEMSEEEEPPAKAVFQDRQAEEGSIEMETSEEEPPPAKPVFQDRQAEEGSIEIEMSGEEPPPAKPAFQDRQAEEDSIEIEMSGEDGAAPLPRGDQLQPLPMEAPARPPGEPALAPVAGDRPLPLPLEAPARPRGAPAPVEEHRPAAAAVPEPAGEARAGAPGPQASQRSAAPTAQVPSPAAPVSPVSPPAAAAVPCAARASEARPVAAREHARGAAQEQPAGARGAGPRAVCGGGAPVSTAAVGGEGGLGLLDMMDRAVRHVEGGALEQGPRPVCLTDWPCPSCTHHNDAAAMSCEVCSAARQCEGGPGPAQESMQSGGSRGSRAHPAAPRPPAPAMPSPALQPTSPRHVGSGDNEPRATAATLGGGSGRGRPSAMSNIVSRVDVVDQAVHRRAPPGAAGADVSAGRSAADSGGSIGFGLGSGRALAGLREAYRTEGAVRACVGEDEVSAERPGEALEGGQEETAEDRVVEHAGMEAEWSAVAARTAEMAAIAERAKANAGVVRHQDASVSSIAWREVHQWILQVRILPEVLQPLREEEMDHVRCGCMARRRSVSDVPGLDRKLSAEKDLVLMMKMTKFDFNETVHARMLRTMYFKLTRNRVCGAIGGHWEVMGFQHTDPRTDLNRANGVLNVIHMFSFYTRHFDIFKGAFTLAQDAEQNYPLACVCVNITQMVMTAFLSGALSSLCNSGDRGVFDTLCCVFAGGLFHFYSQWRSQKRTIGDTDQTFKEVEQLVNRRPAKLLDALTKGAAELKARSDPSRLEFSNLEFGASRQAQPQAAGPQGALPSRLRNYQHE